MSKEAPGYRENLADILEFTGGKRLLSTKQVKEYTGLVDERSVKRHFPMLKGGYISAPTLAVYMLKGTVKGEEK